jgi:hypothetical protein
MSVRDRDYYLHLRREYEPENINLVIVAESPPASGKYFYDPTGSPKEPLFAAIMLQLGLAPIDKEAGLLALQEKGWVLVDATYQPVDKISKGASHDRDEVIVRDYPLLLDDLASLMPDRSIPLVLIKANVCRTLEPLLLKDGFTVLNGGRAIYFPSHGQQSKFKNQFAAALSETTKMQHAAPVLQNIMPNESDEIKRGPPRRYLDKQEAIRHLVHGAIRLVIDKEDPFVIQLIAHSADKLLIDVAKKKGTYLELDWELYIKDEYHKDFFEDYRQTYNYFKHADKDFTKRLPVYDIAILNVMAVFMCAVNYVKLFEVSSHHVRVYFWFVQLLMPNIVKSPDAKFHEMFQETLEKAFVDNTPAEFFELVSKHATQFSLKTKEETAFDLQDVVNFYRTPISELRSAGDERRERRRQSL